MRRRDLLACVAGGFGTLALSRSAIAVEGRSADERVRDATTLVPVEPAPPDRRPVRESARDRDRSLERRNQRCATDKDEDDEACVRFTDSRENVIVDGAIRTPSPCHELALEPESVESATDDSARDVLEITVAVGRQSAVCVQCLGVVEYTASIAVGDRRPDRVAVVHERRDETVEVTSVSITRDRENAAE